MLAFIQAKSQIFQTLSYLQTPFFFSLLWSMLKEMLSPEEVYVYFARSFPTHSPSPPITWYISFALEK